MKQMILSLAVAFGAIAFSGCGGTTLIDDPVNQEMRSIKTLSYAEYAQAARAACKDALSSPIFTRYLNDYKTQKGAGAIPVMEIVTVRNQTEDPNIKTELLTDEIFTSLMNSGLLSVTKATGANKVGEIGAARDLSKDPNFDQSTVQPRGTLIAPDIMLEGSILDNIISEGRTTQVTRSFNMRIINTKTGIIVWSYNKPFAFEQTRGWLGL